MPTKSYKINHPDQLTHKSRSSKTISIPPAPTLDANFKHLHPSLRSSSPSPSFSTDSASKKEVGQGLHTYRSLNDRQSLRIRKDTCLLTYLLTSFTFFHHSYIYTKKAIPEEEAWRVIDEHVYVVCLLFRNTKDGHHHRRWRIQSNPINTTKYMSQ